MARDLNAPENWLAWIKACQKDPGSPLEARGSLGMVTGTDARVLGAIAACWKVGDSGEVLAAVRALLPLLQTQCHPFARELIAQQWDWNDRDRLWPLVSPELEDRVISVQIRAASNAEMLRALELASVDFRLQTAAERALEEKKPKGAPS
jgi:hypothetical protein